MRLKLCLAGTALLLGTVGCEVETGYGGGYGAYGEYPSTYYGGGAYYPGYVSPQIYVAPYDRDHYWDRDRHWDRERRHGDEDWDRH
ncbi:MAG: hypothetical protein ACREIC_23625 [Limisphaerales bacterium]